MALKGQTGFRQVKIIADMAAPFVPKSVRAAKSVPKSFLLFREKPLSSSPTLPKSECPKIIYPKAFKSLNSRIISNT